MTTTIPDSSAPASDHQNAAPATVLDRWSDPTLILIAAAVVALVSLLPWAIRALVTFPLALVLPGHALLAALDRPDRSLSGGARVAFRVVLSLGIIALVVLVVGSVVGVSKISVVGGIWAFTSVGALAGWNRELPGADEGRNNHFTQSGVLLAITAFVAVVVVATALVLLPEPRDESFSRMSLTGTSQSSGSPIRVRSGRTASVQVEVENGTSSTVVYRVIPAIDGGRVWDVEQVRLRPGEKETVSVKGLIPREACLSRLTLSLSANSKPSKVAPLVLYVRNEAGDACG